MTQQDSRFFAHPQRLLGRIFLAVGLALLGISAGVAAAVNGAEPVWIALLGPLICGGVFVCIGLGFLLYTRRKRRQLEDLLRYGERITAQVVGLESAYNVRMNGRPLLRLVCQYTEGGVTYTCRSDYLRGRPIVQANTVTVLRDPQDRRRYVVELEGALAPSVEL